MMKKIRVSVLMAVYNTDFFLVKRAIDSVLSQDLQDFELIIIDDGSNNDTQNRLLNYAIRHEDRVVYLRHANCGQSKSVTRGVSNSVGEFITILDADDEYKPNHLRACLQAVNDADLIASTTETIVDTEDDYYVPDKHDHSQLVHVDDCILFATLFGKRDVFMDMKFQNRYGADAHFYENVAQKYRVKKVDLRTYIYYRNHPNSICSVVKRQYSPVLV
ncbi:MAG: glycosyltransferase family 2 protein [Bacteroidetes bacterium]|nr:glycosyltransferase family 2 protein [Fibrella sp.]